MAVRLFEEHLNPETALHKFILSTPISVEELATIARTLTEFHTNPKPEYPLSSIFSNVEADIMSVLHRAFIAFLSDREFSKLLGTLVSFFDCLPLLISI